MAGRSRSVLVAVCAKCCSSGFGETELSAGGNVKSNLELILESPGLQEVGSCLTPSDRRVRFECF